MSSSSTNRQVCVVDDDAAIRDALKTILEAGGYDAAPMASSAAFLDRVASGKMPACVLSDLRMPEMSGLDLLRALQTRELQIPVILITGFGDVPMAVEAMKNGAVDFIEKPFTGDRIISAVATALDRKNQGSAIGLQDEQARRTHSLSPREQEVMELLVTGHSNKSAARELGISPRTIEVHRARIMTKTGARNLAELVRMSIRMN